MSDRLDVTAFRPSERERWEAAVEAAGMATLLHTRRFLEYHGDRFTDRSALVLDERGRVLGVLPAAQDPDDPSRVVSHPGATYGGLVHTGRLRGEHMLLAFEALRVHYSRLGYQRLEYRPVPWIYHRQPAQDDLYAMLRLGAERTRCDLSCAVALAEDLRVSSRRRRGRRAAEHAGVHVVTGSSTAAPLWTVIEQTLSVRHDARPVHTLNEISLLAERFPDQIEFVAAYLDETVVAGTVLFHSPITTHAQYIGSTPAGNEIGALDAVFAACIESARRAGRRFFDFGTSNTDGGRSLNASLFEFKAQFGGAGVAYEFYELVC